MSIGVKDLPGNFNGAEILDFAISPDNTKITVGFEVYEGDKKSRVWLCEWEIASKRLIAKAYLPNPISPSSSFVRLQHQTMQYTSTGSQIIVHAGHDLYALDSVSLYVIYSDSFANAARSTLDDDVDWWFAISGDGNTLVVLSGQSLFPNKLGSIRVYETRTGKRLSNWSVPALIRTLSLAPDGSRLLVTLADAPNPTDILLLDSISGRIVKTFVSGFGYGPGQGAFDALFADDDHFVVSPGGSVDANGNYTANSLKVLDSHTGEVTKEFTYEKLGPSGDIWVSSRDSTLATLNLWMSHFKRRFNFTESGPKHSQLLFFHQNASNPFCVLGPLPEKSDESPRQSGFIRFSPDLRLVGLYFNHRITLYQIPECKRAA